MYYAAEALHLIAFAAALFIGGIVITALVVAIARCCEP